MVQSAYQAHYAGHLAQYVNMVGYQHAHDQQHPVIIGREGSCMKT